VDVNTHEPNLDPFLTALNMLQSADQVDGDQLDDILALAGRVHGPILLWDAWTEDRITLDVLRARVGTIWSMAEYPDANLDHDHWRDLFDAAGFTVDGHPAPRPDVPVNLWRGSVPDRRSDWSWTTNGAVAARYAAGGTGGRPTGCLYRVTAPPESLLCANTKRDEAEYVVDTRGLRIEEDTTDPGRPA
jgi:hypothetical protein